MQALRHVRLFLKVAELGNLSAAGRALGLPHSSVSRQLAQLEAELGARLVHRSTRSFSLTEAGHAVRLEFLKIADAHAAIEAALDTATPTGLLRVTVSHPFAFKMVVPSLPAFTRRYPGLRVSLSVSNHREAVIGDGFDVAIRNGPSQDSALIGRKLGSTHFGLVASADYLVHAGPLESVDALGGHSVLAFQHAAMPPQSWTLTNGAQRQTVAIKPTLSADDLLVLLQAAEAGMGVTCLPIRLCRESIDLGLLIRCLPHWHERQAETYALYSSRRGLSPKVRAFLDHLTAWLDFT